MAAEWVDFKSVECYVSHADNKQNVGMSRKTTPHLSGLNKIELKERSTDLLFDLKALKRR